MKKTRCGEVATESRLFQGTYSKWSAVWSVSALFRSTLGSIRLCTNFPRICGVRAANKLFEWLRATEETIMVSE